jgi:hypothetical protein
MPTVKVQFYLPDGSSAPLISSQNSNTSIRELIKELNFRPEYEYVVFTGVTGDKYATPLIDLDRSMAEYNIWHSDSNYICDLTIYKKTDTEKYNGDLYIYYEGSK